jgi:membrane protease YdiL (CAAX protease family)
MIYITTQSVNSTQTITLRLILANSFLYGSLILCIFGVIGFQRHSAISIFQLQPSRFPSAAASGLLWLLAIYPLILAVQQTIQHFAENNDDAQLIVRFFVDHPDLKNRISVILMAVVVAPIAEEIIFRGYLYGVMRRYCGRIPALLFSSLLFAAIHGNLSALPGLFILAVTLCLLYERTGSLWANITLHAAFNTLTIVALILWPGASS